MEEARTQLDQLFKAHFPDSWVEELRVSSLEKEDKAGKELER